MVERISRVSFFEGASVINRWRSKRIGERYTPTPPSAASTRSRHDVASLYVGLPVSIRRQPHHQVVQGVSSAPRKTFIAIYI